MAYATNSRVREAARKPNTFRGYEVSLGEVAVVYDDVPAAEALATELGTYAKHAESSGTDAWETFSIVKLPEGWDSMP